MNLYIYDDLPPKEAVRRAWEEPGPSPGMHYSARARVREEMPVLARALNRLAKDEDS